VLGSDRTKQKEEFTTSISLSSERAEEGIFLRPRETTVKTKGSLRVHPGQPVPTVKSRLSGFFIQEEGQDARVAFVEGDRLIHYYLPLELLREGGVRAENQPFELDELVTKLDGVDFTGYRVRASAATEAGHTAALPLDEERKRKLARILARPRNAQG
jgi:hypothetical protein